MSAPNAWSPIGSIAAPAATYASSGKAEAMPAPDSTTTSRPIPVSFFAVVGVHATRNSPSAVSLGTPISICGPAGHKRR